MRANLVNVPVPAYTRGMQIRELVETYWIPRLEEHRPEMVFISAGFDAHREDDMGQLGLVEQDYAWITSRIKDVARHHAGSRIVSCLEGGYNLSALGPQRRGPSAGAGRRLSGGEQGFCHRRPGRLADRAGPAGDPGRARCAAAVCRPGLAARLGHPPLGAEHRQKLDPVRPQSGGRGDVSPGAPVPGLRGPHAGLVPLGHRGRCSASRCRR